MIFCIISNESQNSFRLLQGETPLVVLSAPSFSGWRCEALTLVMFVQPSQQVLANAANITPQWGAADAEIKVPSGENTELKRSPFQTWSRSVYSYTCYAYWRGVLPCLFLPFQSIHLHFFQNLSQFFPVLACRIK